jgi:hydrogenase maturation factor
VAQPTGAAVSVTVVDPDTAVADVALSDGVNTYQVSVTIAFDHAVNLSASSLGLAAQLIDPLHPPGSLPAGVTVDPAFPILISVWPPVWKADGTGDVIFINGDESNQGNASGGALEFSDTYQMEVHTASMDCASALSAFRLYKAPHGSTDFSDITSDLFRGSVRARGRGGSFSQFIVVADTQQLAASASVKLVNLDVGLALAEANNPQLGYGLNYVLLGIGQAMAVLDYSGALSNLDQLIEDVRYDAGTYI